MGCSVGLWALLISSWLDLWSCSRRVTSDHIMGKNYWRVAHQSTSLAAHVRARSVAVVSIAGGHRWALG